MEKLSKEEVLHVARLARLRLEDEEIENYAYKLKEIMNSIEKIKEVDTSSDILITPTTNLCQLTGDVPKEGLLKDEIFKNVPIKKDSYIAVKGVFDEN